MTRPPTAADVATLAGVSRTTVSHILNGRGERFPEETIEKVKSAVRQLDYRPWASGRSLVKGRGETIIVLLPNTTLGTNIQEGLERLSKDSEGFGSNVVLRFAHPGDQSTVESILTMRPMGVVDLGALDAETRLKLLEHGVPTVPHHVDLKVNGDNVTERIADLQVEELRKSGAQKIVYVSVEDARADPFAATRLAGLAEVCSRRGFPQPLHIVLPAEAPSVPTELDRLMSGDMRIGVAAYNDLAAVATLSAASRAGLSVPSDLSIVGVDATAFGRLMTPRLSSVYVDMGAIMHAAFQELQSEIFGTELPSGDLPTDSIRFIEGESS